MAENYSIQQLSNAIQWWMNYHSSVNRSHVLAESSIKYPAVEYLQTSNSNEIKLEHPHPKLSSRRFDLHFKDISGNEIAMEFKFIKNGSTRNKAEKQRVFNDLMRLQLFIGEKKKGYFLICGSKNDFNTDFYNLQEKTESKNTIISRKKFEEQINPTSDNILSTGFYSKWFSFNIRCPNKNIPIGDEEDFYREFYESFLQEYGLTYMNSTGISLELPKTLTTKLIHLHKESIEKLNFNSPNVVAIWEVIY
ncbi:hypothetical protein [Sphingobacterium sp.]|uniref:hypothetical protein n=1 Tax=Sphingobacterium sp. TaxID=341027 RepID=UPI002FD96041